MFRRHKIWKFGVFRRKDDWPLSLSCTTVSPRNNGKPTYHYHIVLAEEYLHLLCINRSMPAVPFTCKQHGVNSGYWMVKAENQKFIDFSQAFPPLSPWDALKPRFRCSLCSVTVAVVVDSFERITARRKWTIAPRDWPYASATRVADSLQHDAPAVRCGCDSLRWLWITISRIVG